MPPFIREQLLQPGKESDFQQFNREVMVHGQNVPIELDSSLVVAPINTHLLVRFSNLLQTDLTTPQSQGGDNWHIATSITPQGESASIAFSYCEEGTPWLTAAIDLGFEDQGQTILQGMSVNLGDEALLDLNDDQGVMHGSGRPMFRAGVDRFVSFLSANIQYGMDTAPQRGMVPVLSDMGSKELALPQQEIIGDLISLCGSPERAMVLMGKVFFDGPTDEQWLEYMTKSCEAGISVDMRSEARATIAVNPIGKFMLGVLNLGISAMGPLEDIFKFQIGIEPIATTGHELQYRVSFQDGENIVMTGKELIKFSKTEVLRAFIQRIKGN
jgi:hypothetical protein